MRKQESQRARDAERAAKLAKDAQTANHWQDIVNQVKAAGIASTNTASTQAAATPSHKLKQ